MPDIKNQFTGGKMNKDVDERLVPKGEYRDAMNIQVSTSEGSDVGTVQNILGNSAVADDLGITPGSICVGAVADEKNDALYWFVKEPSATYNLTVSQSRNIIFELKSGNVRHVFVDMNFFSIAVYSLQSPSSGYIIINSQAGFNAISVGDTFQLFANGVNLSGNEFYTVLSKHQNLAGLYFINIGDYTNASWAGYQAGAAGELQIVLSTGGGVLKFPSKIITGINIIDDMLFWTDGTTEPKKINIPRSIEGTDMGGLQHTRLINPDQNITYSSNILVEEKHVTVIRKSPLKPPTLSQLSSVRSGTVSGVTTNLDFANINSELFNEGDPIDIDILDDSSGSAPNLQIGDTLRLLESGIGTFPPENYTARVVINNIISGVGLTTYKTTISTLSSENPIGSIIYEFALEEEGSELFERKFPRFAYRYKYADNEYSAIGPFSEVAFVPGNFSYHPTEAYNKGMVNNLKKLTLEGFIPTDIPKDVIQVDLLYKNETSPNIYVIKSIVKSDAAWNLGGSYDVLTENIQALLPSNQLLRPWDNVPKSALAQEITGSRIVYGNYTQGYDYSTSKALYSPEIQASIGGRLNQGEYKTTKSIKSLRTYDFGVVYGDKYNRETPVLTVSSATQVVPKSFSSNSSSINISLDENPPLWAEYCKVFVKETSNEYYNLVVDRVYDAEDGNVWLSFPSVDRNKVDEDTYVVLKKGIDNSEAVLEEARYKVVAIKNEAPDYIKTTYTLISEPNQNINGFNLFGGSAAAVLSPAEAPSVGHTSFTVNKDRWTNPYSTTTYDMGLVNLADFMSELGGDDLYVAFSNRVVDDPDGAGVGNPTYTKRVSGKYLITGISDDGLTGNTSTSNTGGADLFEVHLAKPIQQSDDWLTATIDEVYTDGGQLKPHFYRQRVINKPEFDGRFFVKVEEDETIKNKVKPAEGIGLDWKVVASNSLYHLIDDDASPNNGNTSQSASKTLAHWEDNLKFGGSNPKAGWFIDNTFYAGMQPGGNNSIANSVWEGDDPSVLSTFSGSQVWSGDGSTQAQLNQQTAQVAAENGTSNGVVHSDGLYTHPTTSDLYFHLSYSMLESAPNQSSLNDNWTVGNDNPNNLNAFTEDQTVFVSNLKAGKYFRIKGNDSVYIITDAYTERLYNHDGRFITWIQGSYLNLERMTADTNKRLRWTIRYELYGTGQPLASNSKFVDINNDTAGVLEFVEPFVAEKPNVISSNPAIFETEPKEDTDLDIYYEAANSIPLEFTIANREQFIPPGATVNFEDTNYLINNSIPEDLHVVGWGPSFNTSNATTVDENSVVLSHEIPIGAFPSTLKFVRPDGSWVEAVITGAPTTALNTGIVAFTIGSFTKNIGLAWFNCWSFNNGVESNRIGDTFNKPFISNGVKVSTPLLDQYKQETRKYGLIYSGLYNSNSGVNNLNQFIAAEKITKDINPIYGSIQKLHSGWGQSGDLVALCEDRVLKILANKDALFNADGNVNVTSTNSVLGQTIPYSGEYGISQNPESFASEAYRIYFTDKVRGTVMRLSMDGLTPISNHGMKDWFRDNLKLNSTILGSYDDKKDEYNVTLQQTTEQTPKTVTFKENVKGWVSFKSFIPENAISCANEYYTFKNAKIWKHHDESVNRNTFYNEGQSNSTINVILNDIPGSVKSFNTINYEGSQSRVVPNLDDNQYYNLASKPGWYVDSIFTNKESGSLDEFIEKEGKWFNHIRGKEVQHSGNNIIVNPDGSSSFDQASFAIQGLGILGGDPTVSNVYGCTDLSAPNYNPDATVNDGSCIPVILGCTQGSAFNTCNNSCNTDDGSCVWYGCTCAAGTYPNECTNTSLFTEYHDFVNGGGVGTMVDDGSCIAVINGCMDVDANNYNSSANEDDGSCTYDVLGCTFDSSVANYNPLATLDDGKCVWYGCLDPDADNYDEFHPDSNGYQPLDSSYGKQHQFSICTFTFVNGCTDSVAVNYDPNADIDDGSCIYCNWYPLNSQPDGSHIYTAAITDQSQPGVNDGVITVTIASTTPYTIVSVTLLDSTGTGIVTNALATGATASSFQNLAPGFYYIQVTSSTFTTGNGSTSCVWNGYDEGGQGHGVSNAPIEISGCTDPNAENYDSTATQDDGSCSITCYQCDSGCAQIQQSFIGTTVCPSQWSPTPVSCISGCTDSTASNYDPGATCDDDSCIPHVYGCMDGRPRNDLAIGSSGVYVTAATNYNPAATIHDGSCIYNTSASTANDSSLTTGSGAFGGNFLGYTSGEENWLVKNSTNSSNAWAIYNVGDLPLIRWPGYYADGQLANSCSTPAGNSSGTRFSYETARDSGCQGDLNTYYGGTCISGFTGSGFRWHYSNDNGYSWQDGNTLTYTNGIPDQAIELVRFNKYVNSSCASSKIDFSTYPNGYNGKFKQNAKFTFLEWDWNVGVNVHTETIPGINQYSESPKINSGCMDENACNYDVNYNFPSHTFSPCLQPTAFWYWGPDSTCSGLPDFNSCYTADACGNGNGTCNGIPYPDSTACDDANN